MRRVEIVNHPSIDPKDDPDYLTLSAVGRECGARTDVLRTLIRRGKLTKGVQHGQRGVSYIHRDHVPNWAEVEAATSELYRDQLERMSRTLSIIEREVESLRYDVNEAQDDPYGPLGDDIRALTIRNWHARSHERPREKTLARAVERLQMDADELETVKKHLDDVRYKA